MPKILILESEGFIRQAYKRALPDMEIVEAINFEEAKERWENNGPFDCVVVCGLVNSTRDTRPFVRLVRETFQGPVVAASNMASNRKNLMAAGCSHQVNEGGKNNTAAVIREALGI